MNFSKVLIGALTAVTLAVVAFVFIVNPLFLRSANTGEPVAISNEKLNPPGDSAPRVAIITPTTLDVVRVKTAADLSDPEPEQDVESEAIPADGEHASDKMAKSEDIAAQLLIASVDYLSGSIANELSRTGRLEVVEPLRVSQVMDELARSSSKSEVSDPEETEKSDKKPTKRDSFFSALYRTAQGRPGIVNDADRAGTLTESYESQNETVSNSSSSESLYRADLAEAAMTLGAKYILVVYVSEPRYESFRQDIPDTNRHVHVIRADPVISYRLFEGVTGTVVLSEVTSAGEPIEIVYEDGSQPVASAYAKAKLSLERAIAQDIVINILDTIYPPQISSADIDLITIDRGARDGVLVGDVFEISRDAGEAVGAGNIGLDERVRKIVGSVKVVRVQNTLAYVEGISGGPFVRGDYVETLGSDFATRRPERDTEKTSKSSRSNAEPAPVLGARMAAERDAAVVKPRVAVRELDVQYIDCAKCVSTDPKGDLLAESMQAQLQNEDRITVLSRQDMEAVLKERAFSDNAAGRSMRAGLDGMASAHYLLSGTLSIAPHTSVSTERVAGRNVETGRSSSLRVSGQIRILDAESMQQIEATTVEFTQSGSVSQANLRRVTDRAATIAVTDLMKRLFPLAVLEKVSDTQIEISGGEQAGLTNGTRLQVYSKGPDVTDLYSGQSSSSRTKSGVIVVSDVRRDRATARFLEKPFEVKRGDQLEFIAKSASAPAPVAVKLSKSADKADPVSVQAVPDNPDEF